MSRHATDRKDWKVLAECPDGGEDHLQLEATATNSEFAAREAIPIEECPLCGAELDVLVEEKPTEVLR